MSVAHARRRGGWRRLAWTGAVAAGLLAGTARAPAIQISPELEQMYAAVSATPPTSDQMMVCYGFVCRLRTFLYFTAADRKALTAIMAEGRASPEAERKAVQKAVVWFDRRMGPILGTTARVARADFRHRDDNHNFDCFDTTRNTVSLLLVLQDWKLFRHHTVGRPRFRGNILVGQTPHNTAVLTERTGGRDWVVDMWPKSYGQLPDVMTVEQWMTEN
jgi:hypothetical protein